MTAGSRASRPMAVGAAIVAAALATHPAVASPASPAAPLSVLTYNVEGLPWPVRLGRDKDLASIGERLHELRIQGRQPTVVVLQEAFTPAAKGVVVAGGYRYVADGPSSDMAGPGVMTAADRRFAQKGRAWLGETEGKWLDSGLRVASDYPIVAVRRMAFPAFACAGFDCLANKGVLAVAIRMPGVSQPVVLVATHLNSRAASHAPLPRALYAYQRQVDVLGAFVRQSVPAGSPFILAGDLNVGPRFDRHSYLIRNVATWRSTAPVTVAIDSCLRATACVKDNIADIRFSRDRARDWQFFSYGRRTDVALDSLSGLFGHDARGAMLSDHVGYVASYRLRSIPLRQPLTVASQ